MLRSILTPGGQCTHGATRTLHPALTLIQDPAPRPHIDLIEGQEGAGPGLSHVDTVAVRADEHPGHIAALGVNGGGVHVGALALPGGDEHDGASRAPGEVA